MVGPIFWLQVSFYDRQKPQDSLVIQLGRVNVMRGKINSHMRNPGLLPRAKLVLGDRVLSSIRCEGYSRLSADGRITSRTMEVPAVGGSWAEVAAVGGSWPEVFRFEI